MGRIFMDRIKFVRVVFLVAVCIAATVFNSCGEVGGDDSGGGSNSSSSDSNSSENSSSSRPSVQCKDDYNELTHFCGSDGKSYERCGGAEYEVTESFCSGGKFYLLCGNDPKYEFYEYDPSIQFCSHSEGKAYLRCNGKEHDPGSEFCFGGSEIVRKCGNENYNPEERFCLDNRLYFKCGGNEYNPNKQFCSRDFKLYPKCFGTASDSTYNPADSTYEPLILNCCGGSVIKNDDKFCSEGKPWDKCGTENIIYEPSKEFCRNGRFYPVCDGDSTYSVIDDFCFGNLLYKKCNGIDSSAGYNPVKQFCYNDLVVTDRCGGQAFNPKQFCHSGTIHDRCGSQQNSDGTTGERYNPAEKFCFEDQNGLRIPRSLCPTPYTFKQYCSNLKIEDACDIDGVYTAPTRPDQKCIENKFYKECGSNLLCQDTTTIDCNTSTRCYEIATGTEVVTYKKCGNKVIDIRKDFCRSDIIYRLCADSEYNPITHFCPTRGPAVELCQVASRDDFGRVTYTATIYDTETEACLEGAIVPRSGSSQKCIVRGDGVYLNVDGTPMTEPDGTTLKREQTHFCCFGKVYAQNSGYFCYDNELYDLCNKQYPNNGVAYNPNDSICYVIGTTKTLKPNCLVDGITGQCAYSNSLLRCKQLGDGFNYIIDPLPGMECQDNGAIVSLTGSGIETNVGYPVAQIGEQIWTTKNLEADLPASRCYDGNCTGYSQYGFLYDWVVAMNLTSGCYSQSSGCPYPTETLWRGICPKGFAFPTSADWQKLVEYAGGAKIAAGRLKDSISWNGTDDYGFKALPGGYDIHWESEEYTSHEEGTRSIWWTYNQERGNEAYYFDMISADTEVRTHLRPKDGGAYVRCVRYGAF